MTDSDNRPAFENRHVLVTGGLGFIGSNLARRLLDAGARVTLIDSLIPEYGGNLFNIAGIEDRLRVNFSDVRDEYSMRHLVRDQDFLFNLAGQTSHMDSMADPRTDLDINCRSQLSILEACRLNNPAIRVVFASTRQIYGRPRYLPVDEKHLLCPVDVNGVNKMAGEFYHSLYHSAHGMRTCSLRMTNTIGPRMRVRDGRQTFLGIWIRCLVEGRPFEVWGGDQLRDFTYVDDCVDALLCAAARDEAAGQVFNLGGDGVISLKDLAAMLVEINGGGSFEVREYPPDRKGIDIGDYYADYGLIRRTLGWQPCTPLREALSRTLQFYRAHLDRYV